MSTGEVRAQTVIDTIPVGVHPSAIAVNEVTNKIYVANCPTSPISSPQPRGTVTVIDAETRATSEIPVGVCPGALAVNSATNKIYVANFGRLVILCTRCYGDPGSVTIIDGATNSTRTITSPEIVFPRAISISPVTNLAYVADSSRFKVVVIDGVTDAYSLVALPPQPDRTGTYAFDLAVNPATSRIYVTSFLPWSASLRSASAAVAVIDGATNAIGMIPDRRAINSMAIAVNPFTDKVYVANHGNTGGVLTATTNFGSISVIDGPTHSALNIVDSRASVPHAVGVNPLTNKVYVGNARNVTVVDGATNAFVTTADSSGTSIQNVLDTRNLAVDVSMDRVYVANRSSSNITVIDGPTYATTTIADPLALGPHAVAVNTVTGRIYVANYDSNNVTVIDGTAAPATPLPECTTVSPGADWVCVNGDWHQLRYPMPEPVVGACPTVRPGPSFVCVHGNWLPPGFPLPGGGTVGGGTGGAGGSGGTGSTACTTIKPAANWVCVGTNWLPPWHPLVSGH